MRPLVALLTDFGTRDSYVAAVKGVLLSQCPEATLVDVTHEIAPFDVLAAALELESVFRFFPPGAVFLAVVDPGVGSARGALAVGADGRRFVGPDNGVLSLVIDADPQAEVRQIVRREGMEDAISPTFHARDVFAPIAARLARGTPLSGIGPQARNPVKLTIPAVAREGERGWIAMVLHVDHFGNLVTNVTREQLERVEDGGRLAVHVGDRVLPLVRTYSDVPQGEGAALLGGSGRLEVAVCGGSAAARFAMGKGDRLVLRQTPSGAD